MENLSSFLALNMVGCVLGMGVLGAGVLSTCVQRKFLALATFLALKLARNILDTSVQHKFLVPSTFLTLSLTNSYQKIPF